MQRTKRLYADTRTAQAHSEAAGGAGGSNLDRLNEDLQDVTRIMTKNMEDLLWREDSLDREFMNECNYLSLSNFAFAYVRYLSLTSPFLADLPSSPEMSTMSSSLRDESLKYRRAARQINLDALYRKWAP